MTKFSFSLILSLTFLVIYNCDNIDRINETSTISRQLNESSENFLTVKEEIIVKDVNQSTKEQHEYTNSSKSISETRMNLSSVSPETPSLSNDFSEDQLKETPLTKIVDEKLQSNDSEIFTIPSNQKVTQEPPLVITDDIPTFVEYQQMIEKESKQKREKSDSIPSSPTMIIKDNHAVKGVIDPDSSHVTGDHQEPSSLSQSKTQETKSDTEASHNPRMTEDLKVEWTTSVLSKSLMKNNVAAKECGAKILEISSQITHAGFVLNNNKDEYMNVPCSVADKWFVVETCEPVQIRSIQIANFEMFSSRPKTFKVTTADRYPVKHWNNLGLFRAHDEKGIQTFEVSDTRMVKYLKFEMVDHYGNEHYCPLTFVRVMGNVVIDDMDEEHDEDQPAIGEKNETPVQVPSKADSNGLLTKAKDMISKIVNGIGGSSKQNEVVIESELAHTDGKENVKVITTESPCYFFEFLSKNFRNYFQDVWINFERLDVLGKHVPKDIENMFHSAIISQPSPSQIRVEYFFLLELINKTDYSFFRLFQSFLNVSSSRSKDHFLQNSLQNLSDSFKCHLFDSPSLAHHQPILLNVTSHSHSQNTSLDNSPPSVIAPEVVVKVGNVSNGNSIGQAGQYEPTLPGNGDVLSTSSHPLVANISDIQDGHLSVKEESSSDISEENKTAPITKEAASPLISENSKSPPAKHKPEEVFDHKMFSNPGSNAWNHALMRNTNLVKQLEVNVSISWKYLEELSQNYKQQTDKWKKFQLEMASNVTRLENMINQERQETRMSIKELKTQMQTIIIRMRFGMCSESAKKRSSEAMNLSSMDKDIESGCMDLLAEDISSLPTSWFQSSILLIVFNVFLSIVGNALFLALFYNKMKNSILNDVAQRTSSVGDQKRSDSDPRKFEEIAHPIGSARSLTDLRSCQSSYPVVLPPRGVHIPNFPDHNYLSDDDNMHRKYKALGPHFYPVNPSVNFVTPSKSTSLHCVIDSADPDKKKKKRR